MRNTRLQQLIGQNARGADGIKVRASAAGGIEVEIYDVIDPWFGASAAAFSAAIAGGGAQPLTIHINSPGGDAFEGRAIASLIRQYAGPTTAVVDGYAASAASTIAIAANTTTMAQGAFLMIHEAWTFAMGNTRDLIQTADLLSKVDGELAKDYAAKAGVTPAEALAWMQATTWFTADEAVAAGLAANVLANEATLLPFNLAAFEHVPDTLQARIAALSKPREVDHGALRAAAERRLRLYDFAA